MGQRIKIVIVGMLVTSYGIYAQLSDEQLQRVPTCREKIKQCVYNSLISKASKLVCCYVACGKSCQETGAQFGEFKLITLALQHPYICGALTGVSLCTCAGYTAYKKGYIDCCLSVPYTQNPPGFHVPAMEYTLSSTRENN